MVEGDRVDPKVLQTALLDEIAGRLLNLEKLTAKQIPEGIEEPLHIITATTAPQVVRPPQKKNWFSVSVANDGTSDCNIIVNTKKSSTTPYLLRANEITTDNMLNAVIEDLIVWTDAGTAVLRIKGIR